MTPAASSRVRRVDPERDTTARLRAYVHLFDPAFVAVTGSAAQLEPVWKAFGVRSVGARSRVVDVTRSRASHGLIHVIDPEGPSRDGAVRNSVDDLVHDVGVLLAPRPRKNSAIRLEGPGSRARPWRRKSNTAAYITIGTAGREAGRTWCGADGDVARASRCTRPEHVGMMMMEPVPGSSGHRPRASS